MQHATQGLAEQSLVWRCGSDEPCLPPDNGPTRIAARVDVGEAEGGALKELRKRNVAQFLQLFRQARTKPRDRTPDIVQDHLPGLPIEGDRATRRQERKPFLDLLEHLSPCAANQGAKAILKTEPLMLLPYEVEYG
jgi:hypothetical protein